MSEKRIGRPPSCECGTCQKCKHRGYMRRWYQRKSLAERRKWIAARNVELARKRDAARSRNPARKDHLRRVSERWRSDHPDKAKAVAAANIAVRVGNLVRKPCEVCGRTDWVHKHHDDYSKPLDVRWLCPVHHAARHKELNASRKA